MSDTPEPKRPKLEKDDDLDELTHAAWEHYRNYLDSIEESEEGDIDELQELIEIAKARVSKPLQNDSDEIVCPCWHSRTEMISVLISVAYHHLADGAISEYLMMEQQKQQISSSDANENGDSNTPTEILKAMEAAQDLVVQSLEWYPYNASTWSMGANFGRMSQSLSISSSRNWYEIAVRTSTDLRERALEALNDESIADEEKEWIELLVLNQIIGVEYEDDDDEEDDQGEVEEGEADDEEDDENEEKGGGIYDNGDKNHEKDKEDSGWYSASAVESTSRFMCAMLWSMEGCHDRALDHLKPFRLTHRLHPNVWQISTPKVRQLIAPTKPPLVFQPEGGVIPTPLYESMKKLFAPDSAYWRESDYSNRGYYSFFHDLAEQPSNLIEEVIMNHLLPRAQQCLDEMAKSDEDQTKSDGSTTICGFEWWAHTRPIQANLGHNLHFDTDESMLDQEGKVTHPILSSVLYLTGGSEGVSSGATIILDETPDFTMAGETCYLGIPKDNTFLIFPGNRLHGVLPCPGIQKDKKANLDDDEPLKIKELMHAWKKKKTINDGDTTEDPPQRLTFMVGFWTRNVPATMKHRSLYGPCGPLPPATEEHTWASEIMNGYSDTSIERPVAEKIMTATALSQASPAWEIIGEEEEECENDKNSEGPHLVIPHGIDHRFFVQGAPHCFRSSLFEERDTSHVEE